MRLETDRNPDEHETDASHTIISGTGRAGTTFLVELLTRLGLDTGFRGVAISIDQHAFAGLEHDIRNPNTPYIAKSPWYCQYLSDLLAEGKVIIDHAIIPIRDFETAAKSRVHVSMLARTTGKKHANGGLWLTDDPAEQVGILYHRFSILMETLARHDIPVTLLWYPRLVRDANYTFEKFRILMPSATFEIFATAFAATAKPERVHQFSQADA